MKPYLGKGTGPTLSSLAPLPAASCCRRWCDFAGWQWPWQGWGRTSLVFSSIEMSTGCVWGFRGRVVAGGQFILCLPLPHSALWWPCRPAMPTGESKGRGSGGSWSLRCTCWTQMLTQPDEGLLKTYSPGPHHFSLLFPSLSVFFSDLTELSSDSWPFPWHWIVPPSTIGSLFTHPWLSPQGGECAAYTT